AGAAVQRRSTTSWNPADAAAGARRKPATQIVQFQGQTERETDYLVYDTYGNPKQTQVKARNVANDPTYPPANQNLVALPPSNLTYSAGTDPGYFLTVASNPL